MLAEVTHVGGVIKLAGEHRKPLLPPLLHVALRRHRRRDEVGGGVQDERGDGVVVEHAVRLLVVEGDRLWEGSQVEQQTLLDEGARGRVLGEGLGDAVTHVVHVGGAVQHQAGKARSQVADLALTNHLFPESLAKVLLLLLLLLLQHQLHLRVDESPNRKAMHHHLSTGQRLILLKTDTITVHVS